MSYWLDGGIYSRENCNLVILHDERCQYYVGISEADDRIMMMVRTSCVLVIYRYRFSYMECILLQR